METTPTQHMTIIVLGAVLLAAIAVAVVLYVIQPSSEAPAPLIGTTDTPQDTLTVQEETPASQGFNTAVLQRPEYTRLDLSLFAKGILPVQPPAGTGKTNLFQ